MINSEKIYELIKFEDGEFSINVNVSPSEDTVWLNREQISLLFERDIKTISKHINNSLKEECINSTVAKFATVQMEGNRKVTREIEYFDLDVITSVGYRVKSKRGIQFRKWANLILKQHLITGYSINDKRCIKCQDNIISLNNKVNELLEHANKTNNRLSYLESTDTILSNMLFYENNIFEAYSYIKQLLLSANKEIIIIDGYIDITVLDMLNEIALPITIYTLPSAKITDQDISKFQLDHDFTIYRTNIIHDRFLIIDNDIYSIGSSIKDAGKKRFVMTKLKSIDKECLLKNL